MQVEHDEGVAIRIDPEPCADARKGGSEASVGERIGQQLSLAKIHILGADAVEQRFSRSRCLLIAAKVAATKVRRPVTRLDSTALGSARSSWRLSLALVSGFGNLRYGAAGN